MIFIVIAVIILIILAVLYNMLVSRKNAVTNAFGSIDTMLKKRYDLIPNLVETVKQYMNYEKDTLTKITELRAQAISGNLSPEQQVQVNNELGKLTRGIMVAVENYPDLKANNNFIQLQGTWTETEEQISAARRTYNAAVTDYNNAIEMFPTNMLAGMMGYKQKQVFEAAETERANISAKDLFGK